jgi:hypothetical protein
VTVTVSVSSGAEVVVIAGVLVVVASTMGVAEDDAEVVRPGTLVGFALKVVSVAAVVAVVVVGNVTTGSALTVALAGLALELVSVAAVAAVVVVGNVTTGSALTVAPAGLALEVAIVVTGAEDVVRPTGGEEKKLYWRLLRVIVAGAVGVSVASSVAVKVVGVVPVGEVVTAAAANAAALDEVEADVEVGATSVKVEPVGVCDTPEEVVVAASAGSADVVAGSTTVTVSVTVTIAVVVKLAWS